jgi:hypothetical protein
MKNLASVRIWTISWLSLACLTVGVVLGALIPATDEYGGELNYNAGWFFGGTLLAFVILFPVLLGLIAAERIVENQHALNDKLKALRLSQTS